MTEGDVSNVPMEPRGFRVHIQKTLPFSARDGLAAWSPKLDLIAVVTENEHVLLYRMNGQRVWGFAHKAESDARVEKLNWRPDGELLVLVDAENAEANRLQERCWRWGMLTARRGYTMSTTAKPFIESFRRLRVLERLVV